MIKISKYLDPNLVVFLNVEDRDTALKALVDTAEAAGKLKDKQEFYTAILDREKIVSTGIGMGVAIPHARSKSARELKVALGRSTSGIDFKALDMHPVHLVFMVAAPLEARKEYLQAVAKVARFLKSETLKGALLRAKSRKVMMDIVRDFDGVLPESLKVETKGGRVIYKK